MTTHLTVLKEFTLHNMMGIVAALMLLLFSTFASASGIYSTRRTLPAAQGRMAERSIPDDGTVGVNSEMTPGQSGPNAKSTSQYVPQSGNAGTESEQSDVYGNDRNDEPDTTKVTNPHSGRVYIHKGYRRGPEKSSARMAVDVRQLTIVGEQVVNAVKTHDHDDDSSTPEVA